MPVDGGCHCVGHYEFQVSLELLEVGVFNLYHCFRNWSLDFATINHVASGTELLSQVYGHCSYAQK
jgi:hypothetical protein